MVNFHILYEDTDIVAISKPAGVVVHPDHTYKDDTVADWARDRYLGIEHVGEDPMRPGIVHRLDKDTSGVVIIAKTQDAYAFLKDVFQNGKIKKTYLALVVGNVKEDRGVIDAPIARSRKHFEKRVVGGKQGREREAVTEYIVRERFGDDYTFLEVHPRTGRTHQIRSHLAFLGHPIVCDKLYGGKRFLCPYGLTRQFLHASSLELTLPSGGRAHIEADIPPDLSRCLKELHAADKYAIKESI